MLFNQYCSIHPPRPVSVVLYMSIKSTGYSYQYKDINPLIKINARFVHDALIDVEQFNTPGPLSTNVLIIRYVTPITRWLVPCMHPILRDSSLQSSLIITFITQFISFGINMDYCLINQLHTLEEDTGRYIYIYVYAV